MPMLQTNLRLTPEGKARLLTLAKMTKRSPRDVVELLIAQAELSGVADLTLSQPNALTAGRPKTIGSLPYLSQGGPPDAA
jgi:hypothetical protein